MLKEQGGSVLIGCVENTDSKFFRDSWSRWERTSLTVKLFAVSSEVLSPTKSIPKGTYRSPTKPFVGELRYSFSTLGFTRIFETSFMSAGISQYGEAFVGSTTSPQPAQSPSADPFSTFRRPSVIGSATVGGAKSPMRRSGPLGSPAKLRGITTNNDIDGAHMHPADLMESLSMSNHVVRPMAPPK